MVEMKSADTEMVRATERSLKESEGLRCSPRALGCSAPVQLHSALRLSSALMALKELAGTRNSHFIKVEIYEFAE